MFIRRFTFTILTLITFIFALYHDGVFSREVVSRETTSREEVVQSGVSGDGMIALTEVSIAPDYLVSQKALNHTRTLRAFSTLNKNGDIGLYLESVNPHKHYLVSGGFLFTQEYPQVSWTNADTLEFYARVEDGILVQIRFNVRTMVAIFEPADEPLLSSEDFSGAFDIP